MRFLPFVLITCLPLISAAPHPAGNAAAADAQSEAGQENFLNKISAYIYAAYNLLGVNKTQAEPIVKALERPPLINLFDTLNALCQEQGLEPENVNAKTYAEMEALTGNLTMEYMGGYLEEVAGRYGGVTLVPNNVSQITLSEAVAGVTVNPRLKRRH